MTNAELSLLEKLIESQREMIDVLGVLAESQMVIAQSLLPEVSIVMTGGDDGPQTLQ